MTGAPGTGPGEIWDAPAASGPLSARVSVPGSKSLTNRFLVLAALADGPVTIRGGLASRDSSLMISALVFESRLPVGSSARMIEGFVTRARAMATLCRCPPDSSLGLWEARSSRSTARRADRARSSRSSEEAPA